ncbi:hypothetical protein NDU88_005357 [Pleurodeles waltl]|uniref:Uncharacterized protein n=1 Tax=Pleurodeles waltl TaxID=8319 RepID=A0AAV7WXN5_PLEWA|nr:hypothetical protein NDU88_005357 [Pleurodeles waltl]
MAAEAVTPVFSRVTRTTALAGVWAPSPSRSSILRSSSTSDTEFGAASGATAEGYDLHRHLIHRFRLPAAGPRHRLSPLLDALGSLVGEEHTRVNGRVFQGGSSVGFLWQMTEVSREL